jgi:hypothetical protein
MNYGSIVPSFYFYKFAEAVTQPYTSFSAYRAGNIDEKGNLLKPESSIDTFEYFVIKLKKIFEQLPYGVTKYQLQNYVSTLNLFAEEAEHFNITSEQFHGLMEGLICVECNTSTSYLELLEDMSAGGMAVAGDSPGYNQGGVSGMDPPMVPLQRRKQSISTDPYHMFDVSVTDYERIVGNKLSEIDYLRRFGARNPNSTLTVREPKSGKTYTVPKKKQLKENIDLNPSNSDLNNDGKTTSSEIVNDAKDGIISNNKENEKKEIHMLHHVVEHLSQHGFVRNDVQKEHTKLKENEFSIHRGAGGRDLVINHNKNLIPIELGYTTGQSRKANSESSYIKKWISYTDEHTPEFKSQFLKALAGHTKLVGSLMAQQFSRTEARTKANEMAHTGFQHIGGMMLLGNHHGIELISSAPHVDHPVYKQHEALAKSMGLTITGLANPSDNRISFIRSGFKSRVQTPDSPKRGGSYGSEINIQTKYNSDHPAVKNAGVIRMTPFNSESHDSTLEQKYPK